MTRKSLDADTCLNAYSKSTGCFDGFDGCAVGFKRELVSLVGGKWNGNLDAFNDHNSSYAGPLLGRFATPRRLASVRLESVADAIH